jgi:hypothetical protein
MNYGAILCILLGAVLALFAARAIRIWVALRDLLELPNLIRIRRTRPHRHA